MLRLDIDCPICQGQKKIQCKTCNGTGKLKKTLGIFPKYCPDCNKVGFLPCVCSTAGQQVQNILWYSEKVTKEQKQAVIEFLSNYENSFIIKILEEFLLKNSSRNAALTLELLKHFEWNPNTSNDDRLLVRYALFNDKFEVLKKYKGPIVFELRWYLDDYSDMKKVNHIINLIFQLNNPETFYILKDIITNSWDKLADKQSEIIAFLSNSDTGLQALASAFSAKNEIFEDCLRLAKNPHLLKAIGHFAFRVPAKSTNYIIKTLSYLQDNSVQEANNIFQQLNQNAHTQFCSLLSHFAYLLTEREDVVVGLFDFITDKKTYLIDAEVGLLKALSAHGDGGVFLLKTILEAYSYDDALRATNYMEYMLTFRKDKLSQDTLDQIPQLKYREFKSGGTTTRYMPGAFGGTYSTSSPEKRNTIYFKHIVSKI